MMFFGVGFRLALVALALLVERVGTLVRAPAVLDTLRLLRPRGLAADMDRLREAFRRRSGPTV